MLVSAVVVIAVGVMAYEGYKSYKAGKFVSDIATEAATLKALITAFETKGVAAVETDVTYLISQAKTLLAKIGL